MCVRDRVTLHTEWKSICCCENSKSCHNVMCNTNQEFQHFVNKTGCNWDSIQNHCFLGLCRTSHMWTNGSKISVQPHIFFMHAVMSDTYVLPPLIWLITTSYTWIVAVPTVPVSSSRTRSSFTDVISFDVFSWTGLGFSFPSELMQRHLTLSGWLEV